eukprot:766712-Hanusia_phi.AAC.2
MADRHFNFLRLSMSVFIGFSPSQHMSKGSLTDSDPSTRTSSIILPTRDAGQVGTTRDASLPSRLNQRRGTTPPSCALARFPSSYPATSSLASTSRANSLGSHWSVGTLLHVLQHVNNRSNRQYAAYPSGPREAAGGTQVFLLPLMPSMGLEASRVTGMSRSQAFHLMTSTREGTNCRETVFCQAKSCYHRPL